MITSRPKREIILFAISLLLLWLLPETYVFLLPGLFVLTSPKDSLFDCDDPVKAIGSVVILSFAFWIFSYWITMFVPVRLTHLFYVFTVLFLIGLARKSDSIRLPEWNRENRILLCVLALILATRLVPFFDRITGSVGDMTQHNYMTRIIILNDGFSETYDPVVPFENFGEYPPGFHTLSALVSMLGGYEFHRVTNFLSCVSFVLMNLALYMVLARRFSRTVALCVASVTLYLSHYPQFLNQWGSAPTALSTVFLFFSYHSLNSDRPCHPALQAAAGLALAGGLLSHLVPPVGFLVYLPVYLCVMAACKECNIITSLRRHWLVLATALFAVIPFLINFDFGVLEGSRSAIQHGHEGSLSTILDFNPIGGPTLIREFAGMIVVFLFLIGPFLSFLTLLASVFLAVRLFGKYRDASSMEKMCAAGLAASLAAFIILFAIFKLRLTPMFHLFQMERIHYFLLIPVSFVLAWFVQGYKGKINRGVMAGSLFAFLGLTAWNVADGLGRGFESHYTRLKTGRNHGLFILREISLGSYFAYALDKVNSAVTMQDIRAFEWIRENVDKDAIFLTNYGDGGRLISSIAERKTTHPHGMDVWHASELKIWQNEHRPTHVYVGRNENPVYETLYRKDDLVRARDRYRLIYDRDGCSVFEIIDPFHRDGRRG